MQSRPIVVVGSINTDLVVHTTQLPSAGETLTGASFRTFGGGKGANQAVAASRLCYPVRMIGMVGSDAFGRESLNRLSNDGVDITDVSVCDGESGVALITVSDSGENTIVVVPGANGSVTPEYVEAKRSAIAEAGMVLAQLEIPIETVVRLAEICEQEQVPLMLDPAPAVALPHGLLHRCAWLTPNETEARFYLQGSTEKDPATIAELLLAQGVGGVALKLGERGSYLAMRTGERTSVSSFSLRAVDATAAGDTFNGAFAVGLLTGRSPEESARFASAAAAVSVTREGAQASMPTLAEVEQLLRQGG